MEKKLDYFINAGKRLLSAGFFNVFGATVINSIVTFIYGIFIVRVMSKSEYGLFAYVQNITNFGVLFCNLGVNLGVLQFCSGNISERMKYAYCRFAAIVGSICSFLIVGIMILYTTIDHSGFRNLTQYVVEFSFLPFLYFMKEWITSNLRWQLRNREYGNVMNVHSISNAVFAVVGAIFCGIHGVIIGIYFSYLAALLIGIYYLKDNTLPYVHKADKLNKTSIKVFMKYSLTMCIVNALISILFTVDVFVIGNLLQDTEKVAMYRTASTIPFALNMIPNSIMTFVYPHFALHREDKAWLRKSTKILYLANAGLNILIGIFLFVTAPLLLTILFGSRYNGIVPIFQILIISYIVSSCLRTPAASLFGILRKTKTALIVSASTVLVSICMSILLVGKWGLRGAAIGSVCTFSIVGIVSTAILFYEIYSKE